MKLFQLILLLLIANVLNAQQKFTVRATEGDTWPSQYYLVDERGNTLKALDSTKYFVCFSENTPGYFAVFGIKGEKGWVAIDINERILFKVYNTSFGEPSPDEITENRIRIVDDAGRIGFADHLGNIVIKPHYEIATAFHKGKAIIGEVCKKVPWDEHEDENSGCHHYSIVCQKHGYINADGKLQLFGDFTFEDIQKKIRWKSADL